VGRVEADHLIELLQLLAIFFVWNSPVILWYLHCFRKYKGPR
jgi:hypothetical protein